ncbi:MAG TPA: hypothetical protein VL200_05080 [Lacunisphaera sp.]|nr:hypothetical protein [Lacunisphaera sp.]
MPNWKQATWILLPVSLGIALVVLRPSANGPVSDEGRGVRTTAARSQPGSPSLPASVFAPPPPSAPDLAAEIAGLLATGNANDQAHVFDQLWPELVSTDARAAAKLAGQWPPGPLRMELIRRLARLWSASDIGAAVAWLADLDGRPEQREAVRAMAAELGRTDSAGAIELSQYFGVGYEDGSLEHLVQLWTEESPRDAVAWITSRPAGPERDLLLARIAWVRAQSDPAEAVALVTAYMPPGTARDEALAAVARQWAVRDQGAALAWAGRLPSGPLRARSFAAIQAGVKSR